MGTYQAFELKELQADWSRSSLEFLRRPGFSVVINDQQVRVVVAPPDNPTE